MESDQGTPALYVMALGYVLLLGTITYLAVKRAVIFVVIVGVLVGAALFVLAVIWNGNGE
jgi:hypothetical protein